jgi:hypothetical protein
MQSPPVKIGVVVFWSTLVFFACLRVAFSFEQDQPDIGSCLKNSVAGTGVVSADPERKETGQVMEIQVKEMRAIGDVATNTISATISKNTKKAQLAVGVFDSTSTPHIANVSNPVIPSHITNENSPICANDITIRIKTKMYPRFVFGDTVSFTGKISAPFNFKSGQGRAFDYKGYLAIGKK